MKNFHLPLAEPTYTKHAAVAAYAMEMAGSEFDLDTALESAAIERLTGTAKNGRLERGDVEIIAPPGTEAALHD